MLSGLEGQTALVLQETTSARTPAQGTPPPCSHWPHTAGSARIQRKCSLHAVRPAGESGRTEKRFAGVGLPASSGDHRACWSPALAGPAHLGGSLEFVCPRGGGRHPSVRSGSALFLLRWSRARALLTSVPEKVCFLPLPSPASELDSFPQAESRVLWPHPEETRQKLREAQPRDSVASPASS